MVGLKFSMQGTALSDHAKRTEDAGADLGAMVRSFLTAAEPVASTMNGPVRAAFNEFKQNANAVAGSLENSLRAILESTNEQGRAFAEHADQGSGVLRAGQASADFDAAVARDV